LVKQNSKPEKNSLEFIQHSNIYHVAQSIGLQIDQKKTNPQRAVCPFHDDTDPSLNLYHSHSSNGDRDHYHCFVCGAHGDALSLIQNYENISFWEAAKRLADIQGIELPRSGRAAVDKRSGLNALSEKIDETSVSDAELVSFSNDRGIPPELILEFGGGAVELKHLLTQAAADRATEERLVSAGLIRRKVLGENQPDLYGTPLQGFFFGKRIVFKVGDTQQGIAGFIARSLKNDKPKYLYSYGFPRRTTLFGLDRILLKLRKNSKDRNSKRLDVFLVEGLFDVLRLKSLGLNAIGILGSRISTGKNSQIEKLKLLAEQTSMLGIDLKYRVFMDHDAAGKSGSYDAVIELIKILGANTNTQDSSPPFNLDVIIAKGDVEDKSDPDSLLKNFSESEAIAFIEDSSISALRFLAAYRLNSEPHELKLNKPSRMKLAAEARQIALALGDISFLRAFGPLEFDENDEYLSAFYQAIFSYSSGVQNTAPTSRNQEHHVEEPDDRAAMLTALSFGRASTLKREYPLEDDAWERLAVAASPMFHLHKERLRIADSLSAPLLTRHVPKGDGRYRMKSGPVAEDVILQQYVLLELLRDRGNSPRFSALVPAIRYLGDDDLAGGIYRTGSKTERKALSFAYQIDMDVVNGKKLPGRTGIFRHFFDCWRSFIDHIDDQIRQFDSENLQILRLDITGFYDYIRRDVVSDALVGPLSDALSVLPETADERRRFAPLLDPDSDELPAKRAQAVTEFLLNHSFGCSYSDPKTGEVKSTDPMIGIPQGPDLSAYLANISLFGLDDLMEDEIRKLNEHADDLLPHHTNVRVRASYARYVDDLILVCPDIETALHLRRKIETFLKNVGLALNRKNTTPPPMSRTEARSWLTDNRAGFGFSGPLAELPTTDAMDPLADAGEIDRKSALGLLYDPELDDPENGRNSLSKIRLALSAPDIRFGDRANAFKRLWCFAASEQGDPSGKGLAEIFLNLISEVEPSSLGFKQDSETLDLSLACLDGLEKALRINVPKGELSDIRVEYFQEIQQKLSECVLDDVFSPLVSSIFNDGEHEELLLRYDVRSQIGIIACLAVEKIHLTKSECSLKKLANYFRPSGSHRRPELAPGLWLSLFKTDPTSVNPPKSSTLEGQDTAEAAFAKINYTIVKLQRIEAHGPSEDDITHRDTTHRTSVSENKFASLTNQILQVWSKCEIEGEKENDNKAHQIELDAAATFINITYRHFGEVVTGRNRLMQLIANNTSAHPLPSPPGLETSGILLWSDNKLLLATTKDTETNILGVTWLEHEETQVTGIKLKCADLPSGSKPLYLSKLNWSPGAISAMYRSFLPLYLTQIPEEGSTDWLPVPTAFSFFGKVDDQKLDLTTARLVCWAATKESVDGHAFVRNGPSLEARKVFSVDADFWRYGWAIRDLCDRPDLITDEDGGQDSQASTALADKTHRREAMLARVLPRLSGADKWGAGNFANDIRVPTRIDRALKLLESFGNSQTQEDDASFLIAALTEGVFMSDRINNKPDLSIPGKTAGLILASVRRLSRGLPEVAKLWGPVDEKSPSYYRRSARAWALLGESVKGRVPNESAKLPLETLALGLDITAVVFDLRALAFELSSVLKNDDLMLLGQSRFELSWIEGIVGTNILLVARSISDHETNLEKQIDSLLRTFIHIVIEEGSGSNSFRDMITPAGWVVLLAIILKIIPVDDSLSESDPPKLRPKLWPMPPDQSIKVEDVLKTLLKFLSATGDDDTTTEDWPWSSFEELAKNRPKNLIQILRTLTDLTSVEVENEISPTNPRTGENRGGKYIVRLADGASQALGDWQVDIAHILRERGNTTEVEIDSDHKAYFQYSVSRIGKKVIGLHMVSRQLAEATLQNIKSCDEIRPKGESTTTEDDQHSNQKNPLEHLNALKEESVSQKSDVSDEELIPENEYGSMSDLQRLIDMQIKSWKRRSDDRSTSFRRLAIVQWDVAETYYQPTHKMGKYEGLLIKGKRATEKSLSGKTFALSTTEFRRRKILDRVLEACVAFDVEGIVLPEYSVRPETINWLTRKIEAAGKPIIVWCGTFRVPSGSKIDHFRKNAGSSVPFTSTLLEKTPTDRVTWTHHSALLTCLRGTLRDEDSKFEVQHSVRQKRYPSAAAGELIRPPISEPWHPLLQDVTDPFDLGTYALELICAEMFPHASSSNFVGVLEENIQLLKRYEPGISTPDLLASLNEDIHTFAKWTAYRSAARLNGYANQPLVRGRKTQRTLIVLPAMTSRTADYHIFGQNQYLAAGLVTAFCNAVTPKISIGQSAFIGLNGWTTTEGSETPYGTKAPGIFELGNSEHSGPLGKNEAAIVIADLDLVRTTDQKPRPHYQSRPLRIVAHLPMIFATEAGSGTGKYDYPNGNRKERKRLVGAHNNHMSFEETVKIIDAAFEADRQSRPFLPRSGPSTPEVLRHRDNEERIRTALKMLETFVDDSEWMKKRTASFEMQRLDYPPELPLPALLDWLYIDDRWQKHLENSDKFNEFTDPMADDLPLLNIGAEFSDEPERGAD
jgi:DNA primase catalytic core